MFLVPDLRGRLKVGGGVPHQAAEAGLGSRLDHATAGCHLGSDHLSPCNSHITVAMETSGAEPSLRAMM